MPVIAISVSQKVNDHYQNLKSGQKSKHFNNILERHIRLFDDGQYPRSYKELEATISQLQRANEQLQKLVLAQESDRNDLNPTFMEYILNLPSNILRWLLRR
mgnify:CR=1 FL=1